MGFFSFFKKLFTGEGTDEQALDAARARHGVKIDEKQKAEMDKATTEEQRFTENYDAWEELRNYRWNFFFGNWITRKFRPIGEEKVKKQLEDLEKKRRGAADRGKEEKHE